MGRVLKIADESRVGPAQFTNFVERPVNYFREIVHDNIKQPRAASPGSDIALRMPESEKRRHAAEIERARLEGFEKGKVVGRDMAQQELTPAVELLQNYATMLAAERADVGARFEEQLVNLATRMAEKIINAEMSIRPELLADIVRGALKAVSDAKFVTVRVHPQDLKLLKERAMELASSLSSSSTLDLRPDEGIARGDCIVDTDIGSLDARLTTQLATLKQQLEVSLGGKS